MDYLSYSYSLTNFTPTEGKQEQPRMGLLAVSQLEQVYSTIDIYRESGILRFVPGRVGGQPLDSLTFRLIGLENLDLTSHERVLILFAILFIRLLTPSLPNRGPSL